MAAPNNARQLVLFCQEENEPEFITEAKRITRLFSRMGPISVESSRSQSCLILGQALCRDLGCKLSIEGIWDPILSPQDVDQESEIRAFISLVETDYFPYEVTEAENERKFYDRIEHAVERQSSGLRFVCASSSVVQAALNAVGIKENFAPLFAFLDLESPTANILAGSVPEMLKYNPPLPNIRGASLASSLIMGERKFDSQLLDQDDQGVEVVTSDDVLDSAKVGECDPRPPSFLFESSAEVSQVSNGIPPQEKPEFGTKPVMDSIPESVFDSSLSQSTIFRQRNRSLAEIEAAKLTDVINEDLAKTICESLSTFNRSKEARESDKRLDQAHLALESLKTRFEQVSGLLLKRVEDMQGLKDGQASELHHLISQFQSIGEQRRLTETLLETLTHDLTQEAKALQKLVNEKLETSRKITQELEDLKARQGGQREFSILIQAVETAHDGTQVVKVLCKKHYPLWVFVHVQGPNGFLKRDFRSLTPGLVDVQFGNVNEYVPGEYLVDFEQLETYKPLSGSANFQVNQFATMPVVAPYEDSFLYKNVANIQELEEQVGPLGVPILQRLAVTWINAEEDYLDDFISIMIDTWEEGENAILEKLKSKGYQFSDRS